MNFFAKCKYPAPTKSSEDETYILVTPRVKCAPPFDAATPAHSCIRWVVLRRHSRRQSGQSCTGHRCSRSRGMAAPATAVLWDSCRFSTAGAGHFYLWGRWILGDADVRNDKAELCNFSWYHGAQNNHHIPRKNTSLMCQNPVVDETVVVFLWKICFAKLTCVKYNKN